MAPHSSILVTKASQREGGSSGRERQPAGRGRGLVCDPTLLLQQFIQATRRGPFTRAREGVQGFLALPRGCGVGGVTLGPPSTAPGCPRPRNSPGSEGGPAWGRPGSPWLLPTNSSEAEATLSARGQFPRRWGRGGGSPLPFPASACAQPLPGAQVLAPDSHTHAALGPGVRVLLVKPCTSHGPCA